MNTRSMLVLMAIVISIIAIPVYSSAQTIFTNIGGNPSKQGPSPLDISGTYPNGVQIQPVGSGLARIEIINDGVHDYLVMKNARIITTTAIPAPGYAISFWATLSQLPNAPQQYDTRLNGTFTRSNNITAATGDQVTIQGWFDTTQVGSTQTRIIGGNPNVSITTSTPPPGLGGTPNNRILKHELWLITLNANDRLNVANVNGATVKNSVATDPCEDQPETCDKETQEAVKKQQAEQTNVMKQQAEEKKAGKKKK
ncbi:MAG: hypothetical protein ACREJ6_11660 [Candidatus Methylomirabilis sp.]